MDCCAQKDKMNDGCKFLVFLAAEGALQYPLGCGERGSKLLSHSPHSIQAEGHFNPVNKEGEGKK